MVLGPGQVVQVRWYWAKPGAQLLGMPTAFGSSRLTDRRDPWNPPVGEQRERYPRSVSGDLEPRQDGTGPAVGPPSWWAQGIPPGGCCPTARQPWFGEAEGVVISGFASDVV
jgi:hypothetical protein